MKRYGVLAGLVCVGLAGQQLTREYIRLGGRVIAIESRPSVTFEISKASVVAGCGDTGEHVIAVTASASTKWNVAENSPNLALVAWAGEKTGSGEFRFKWENTNCGASTTERSTAITVAPVGGAVKTLTAVQRGGVGVDFTLAPSTFSGQSHCGVNGLAVTTNAAAGTLTAAVAGAGGAWIENLTVSGTSTAAVTFNLAQNTTNASRTASIELSNNSHRHAINVTQNARPTLTVTTVQPAVFGPSGGSGTLVINSPQTPTVLNVPSWIQINGTSLTVTALPTINDPPRSATLRFQTNLGCGTGENLVADLVVTQTNPNFVPGNSVTLNKNFEGVPVTGGTYSFQITNLTPGTYYLIDYITPNPGMLAFLSPISAQSTAGGAVTIQYRISSNAVQPQGDATDSRTVRFSVIQTRDGTRNGYISHSDFEIFQIGQQKIQIVPAISPKEVINIDQGGCTGGTGGCYPHRSTIGATGKTDSGLTVAGPLNATWYPDFYLGPYFMTMDSVTSIGDKSAYSGGNGYKLPNEFRPGFIFANNSPTPRVGRLAIFYVGQAGVGGGTLDFITYVQKGKNVSLPGVLEPYFPGGLITPTANGNAWGTFKVEAADNEGASNIDMVELRFSTAGVAPVCHAVAQKPSGSSVWQYRLYNDAGVLSDPIGSNPVGNLQCVLKPGGIPAPNGQNLTVPFELEFKMGFRGQRTVQMSATDAAGRVGTQDLFVNIDGAAPTVVSMSPVSGSGVQQVFNFQFGESFGEPNIAQAELLFGEIGGVNCRVRYQHSIRMMSLYDNDLPGISQLIGTGMNLSNNACRITSTQVTPIAGGMNLSVNATFTSAMNGTKLVWARVQNNQDLWSVGDSGWTNAGVWTVTTGAGGGGGGGTTPPSTGTSVALNGNQRLVANVPTANVPDLSSLNEWRIEMRLHNFDLKDSKQLLSANGQAGASVVWSNPNDPVNTSRLLWLGAGPNACRFDVTGKTQLILRWQRRLGAAPEFEVWAPSSGIMLAVPAGYCNPATIPNTPNNFTGGNFVIGGAPWGGSNNLTGSIAYLRMYATAVTVGTAPSTAVESGTSALLRYEFEGSNLLAEAGGNPALALVLDSGTLVSEPEPGGGSSGGSSTTGPTLTAVDIPSSSAGSPMTGGPYTLQTSSSYAFFSSDSLRYAYKLMTGDGQIEAEVTSMSGGAASAKAGVMIRDTASGNLAPGAKEVFVALQAGKCVAQWRANANGETQYVPPNLQANVPVRVKLVRQGDGFSMYCKAAGASDWTALLAGPLSVAMSPQVLVGLAASAENATAGGSLLTAVFNNVSITSGSSGSGPALTPVEVGSTLGGKTIADNGFYTLYTKGKYAFFEADSMHYAYQPVTGSDWEVEALVTVMNGGSSTAKAGVMIREGTTSNVAAGAKAVFVAVQASKCLMQWRDATNQATQYEPQVNQGAVPTWIRLVKQGNTFRGYCKPGAATPANDWFELKTSGVPVTMSNLLIGLGVAAENETAGASELSVSFTNVRIAPYVAPGVTVNPTHSDMLAATGATANFTVTSGGPWTAESRAQACPGGTGCWLTMGSTGSIVSGAAGTATVSYTVSNNPDWHGGRSGPVKVTTGSAVTYHSVRQMPAGNYTTVMVQSPADVVGASQVLTIDMNEIPYTMTGVRVDIGVPGTNGPATNHCFVTYGLSDQTYRLYHPNWVTASQGTVAGGGTISSNDCSLHLPNAQFQHLGAGSGANTNNYRIVLPLTMSATMPTALKAVSVTVLMTEQVGTNVVHHSRGWGTGFWR